MSRRPVIPRSQSTLYRTNGALDKEGGWPWFRMTVATQATPFFLNHSSIRAHPSLASLGR
jgi:hypothetical protein